MSARCKPTTEGTADAIAEADHQPRPGGDNGAVAESLFVLARLLGRQAANDLITAPTVAESQKE
jgi:hypothetical protein